MNKLPFYWSLLLEGREHVKKEQHSGRPSTSKTDENVERVNTLLTSDSHLRLRMLSEQLKFNGLTVHQIFTACLQMRNVFAKYI